MPLPPSISASRRVSYLPLRLCGLALLLSTLALCATVANASAKGPDQPQRIPLEPLGYQAIASRYLLEGATMLTLDYVDSQHLLVTFGVSKLMTRLADCPPDDEDRTVRAVLLELPTGRELAHAEWRFHDLGQYLWNVGDGHFLLRRRDALTALAPMQNLASGDPFAEQPFLHFERRIQAIVVSANYDLLSIETIKRTPSKPRELPAVQPVSHSGSSSAAPQPGPQSPGLNRRDPNEPKPDPTPTEVSFVRILRVPIPPPASLKSAPGKSAPGTSAPGTSAPGTSAPQPPPQSAPAPVATRIVGRLDGRIYTSTAVNVPLTAEGFLRAKSATRDGVVLDFLTFTGKDIDLGDFATSCPPRPTFVSPSEFVAFGCRGSDQSLDLAGFNLKGDFLWQINFTDEQAYPGFASAVSAGRFAFSRTVTSTHVFGNETPSFDQLEDQEVRVIQMYNGRQLLRVVTSPIQRAGQNFTLSPDGLALAVIHDNPTVKSDVTSHHTAIEIYPLPPLSGKDTAQVKLEAAMAPAPSDVHFRFSPEEIKAALAAKTTHEDPAQASQSSANAVSPADSRIAGDTIPPPAGTTAASANGTIPSSDPAPACATLTETNSTRSTPSSACPVKPPAKAATAKSEAPQTDADTPPAPRRKPPTLYEPAPPVSPQ